MIQSSRCRRNPKRIDPAHSQGSLKRLNQPCADQFSPDASSQQNHDAAGHTARGGVGCVRVGGDKALKWRPCARAKWITSPQIERSLCVRKLVPHAGFQARGCIESRGVGERLGSLIYRWSRIWLQKGWSGRERSDVKECLREEAHRAGADWKIYRFSPLLCGRSCDAAC